MGRGGDDFRAEVDAGEVVKVFVELASVADEFRGFEVFGPMC